MASEQDNRLVERAVQSGKLSRAQVAESQRMQQALHDQGVKKSLVEILHDEGAVTRSELAEIDDPDGMLGRTLGGFLVEAKLGEGGMGAVFRAKQISLGRRIALKVLTPQHARNPEFIGRFLREARSAARLNHPHVVQPLEIGAEQGFHYFAMELCEGGSVAGRLEKEGRYAERDALEVVRAVGLALAYADELGIIHRDIKPDNILLTRSGIPKLADLGLAKGEGESITMTGMIMGTPNYMSPEQAKGQSDLDSRTDVYALGITLFEMVTGKVPFRGGTPLVILNQHVNEPLPDPRSLAPHLSDDVVALIRRMTAKSRDERFRKPAEMVLEVERLLGHKPSSGASAPASSGGQRALPKAAASPVPASGGSKVASGGEKKRPPSPAPVVTAQDETIPAPSSDDRKAARATPDGRAPGDSERPSRSRREEKSAGAQTVDMPAPPPRRATPAPAAREATADLDLRPAPRGHGRLLMLLLALAATGGALVVRPDWRDRASQSASLVKQWISARFTASPPGTPGQAAAPPPSVPGSKTGPPTSTPPASAGRTEPAAATEEDDRVWVDEYPARFAAPARPASPAEAEALAQKLLAAADRDDKAGAYASALESVRAARTLDEATSINARSDELLYWTALLVSLADLQSGEVASALSAIANVPPARALTTADVPTAAICGRADSLRDELETLRGAISDISARRFASARMTLESLGERRTSALARAAGAELPAMLAYATASDEVEGGDYASAKATIERASPGLAASRFARAREQDVRALLAEIAVAPRLESVIHADAARVADRRLRLSWRFVPAPGARAAGLTDWTADPSIWTIDASGLCTKMAAGPGLRHPAADLQLPLKRLDSAEIAVTPERSQMFLLSVGTIHIVVMQEGGRVHAGTSKWPEWKANGGAAARGARLFEPPADWVSGAAAVTAERPYTLSVSFVHPAGPADAPHAIVSIDGEQALSVRLPAPPAGAARPETRVEIRASHTLHVRSVVVEGVPDWLALEKKLPK